MGAGLGLTRAGLHGRLKFLLQMPDTVAEMESHAYSVKVDDCALSSLDWQQVRAV